MLASFPCTSNFQELKANSAETEKTNQSQGEFQESLWIFEQEEMLSIGIEEVSNTPWTLKSSILTLLSRAPS